MRHERHVMVVDTCRGHGSFNWPTARSTSPVALLKTDSLSGQAAPVQSPATPPAGCSVVLSAGHGTTVNAPTHSSNYFYGPSVFNFSRNAAENGEL